MASSAIAVKEDWTVAYLRELRACSYDRGAALTALGISKETYRIRLGDQEFREAANRVWLEMLEDVEDNLLKASRGTRKMALSKDGDVVDLGLEFTGANVKAAELLLKAHHEAYRDKQDPSGQRFDTLADMVRAVAAERMAGRLAPAIQAERVKDEEN